jgi:hypothetical protein
LSPFQEFDQIALWGQQKHDTTSAKCGGGNGFAQGHAPVLPTALKFSIQIYDLVTQMIYPAPAAADDGIDRAVLAKGLHQLDQQVTLHPGEANRHSLDRIGDFVADGERRENRAEEVFDESVDIGGGVTHVVKTHRSTSRILGYGRS